MENIERIGTIKQEVLNGEYYFKSLLREACKFGMLCEADLERINYQCLDLLAYKTGKYNSGDSSSIRIETAESIMASVLYTVGLWLKTFSHPDFGVKAIKEINIRDIYQCGRKRIDTKLKAAKHFHLLALRNKIDTDNYTYNATILDGINGFFKLYNPDYGAQEIHITADYPVCVPAHDLTGIEFIQKYLESFYYENMLCSCFAKETIRYLLNGYNEGYRDLVFNIFELILTTAIGCKICGIEAKTLSISKIQVEYLYQVLSKKSKDEVCKTLWLAYSELKKELSLSSVFLDQYIQKSLEAIASNIYHAMKMNTLDRIVIVPLYPKIKSEIYFSLGIKMADELFRNIVEEITECRFLSDKISIIKGSIHSLSDMEDILLAAELNADEITAVLSLLELIEVAVLVKRHPLKADIDAIDLSKQERVLCYGLNNYILSLTPDDQSWIDNAINIIVFDKFLGN